MYRRVLLLVRKVSGISVHGFVTDALDSTSLVEVQLRDFPFPGGKGEGKEDRSSSSFILR